MTAIPATSSLPNPPCPDCFGFSTRWIWPDSDSQGDVWACLCGASWTIPVALPPRKQV